MGERETDFRSPSFQLPTLPVLKTPSVVVDGPREKLQEHSITPLKRSKWSTKGAIGERSDDYLMLHMPDSQYGQAQEYEYDYSPFCDKPFPTTAQIQNYKHAETVVHCMLFHKDAHSMNTQDDLDSFQPETTIHCDEDCMSSPKEDSAGYHQLATSMKSNSLLLQSPAKDRWAFDGDGAAFHEQQRLWQELPRPSLRQANDILAHELDVLNKFWSGSTLIHELGRNYPHELYLILQEEGQKLDRIREELHQKRQQPWSHLLDD